MNYFKRKNLLIILLVALFVINISALATIIFNMNKFKRERGMFDRFHEPKEFFKKKFDLEDHDQLDWFMENHQRFRDSARNRFSELTSIRDMIRMQLIKTNPNYDSLKIYAEQIGEVNIGITMEAIDHFVELGKKCNPEQRKILNEIISEVFSHGPPPQFRGEKPPEGFEKQYKFRKRK